MRLLLADDTVGAGVADGHPQSGPALLHLPGRHRLLEHLLPADRGSDELDAVRGAQLDDLPGRLGRGRRSNAASLHRRRTAIALRHHSLCHVDARTLRSLCRK